ncbi:cell wall-binding repeat-containing protein [Agrococcus beijingensis]|uniref:cell wall-binding repeat-containing protein n=1 Tax=Agrococcus beijingensis TaxID=3068634 RepID=UPI0027416A33|nr:cell wall-binding repeat-containing protein [Agrococcus sp. REN33]
MRAGLAALAVIGVVATAIVGGAAPAANAATSRIDGDDRFETAVLASQQLPRGEAVFLASGMSFPDALAAAPVAASEGAHLLLVRPEGIPQVALDEIRRLAPSEVVILGSEATLSATVATQAQQLSPKVTRIGGADRVETSMLLLDRMRLRTTVTDVWVASGSGFPDALAAGAVAAREGHGVILTLGASPAFEQRLASRVAGVQRFHIPGSTASVGDDVRAMLAATGRSVDRFPGSDRYETAVLINRAFTPPGSGTDMVLASGAGFPDGLVGAVFAGLRDEALYLTSPHCATSTSVADEQRRLGSTQLTVLGGLSTVSADAAALKLCPPPMPSPSETASALLQRINAERAAVGARPLALDACLEDMAEGWAGSMAAQRLAGSAHNPSLTAEARACALRGWGENVGRTWGSGGPDANRIMTAWMASEGHRLNIQRASFTHIGIGVATSSDGYAYYVLDFGTR